MAGPSLERIVHRLSLSAARGASHQLGGGAVAADGSLRVVAGGTLFAIDAVAWTVRWSLDVAALGTLDDGHFRSDPSEEPARVPRLSLPTILDGDRTLVVAGGTAVLVDAGGALLDRLAVPLADDSGLSPNVDLQGHPVFTTIDGDVLVWRNGQLANMGRGLGYDLVPVAVYEDGSLAVSGYAGRGFCRITEGATTWRTDFQEADLLPTVNHSQCAAVGSLNEGCSAIFDPAGRRSATYPTAAVFAACHDGDWLALGRDSLARLSPSGVVRWSVSVDTGQERRGVFQPIVDVEGTAYLAARDSILSFSPTGARRSSVTLGGPAMPLFPVRPGLLATVCGDELLVVA